jgi:hypothetical protein
VLEAQLDPKRKGKEPMDKSEEIAIFWMLNARGTASGAHTLTLTVTVTVSAQSVGTTIEFFVGQKTRGTREGEEWRREVFDVLVRPGAVAGDFRAGGARGAGGAEG